jgi:hypothetical protein
MNTEPKPATGEHQPSCQAITSERGVGPFPCDCKPTSGEWTGGYVETILNEMGYHGLSNKHNAALAAAIAAALEKERIATVSRLDQQLANAIAEAVDLETRRCHANWSKARDEAVTEAQKPLADALTRVRKTLCSGGGLREATDIIDDALAEVGK